MKDSYSFDISKDQAMKSYQVMYDAYERIFHRAGLKFEAVEADTGAIGGNMSHEFQVLAEAGEDRIANCPSCKKAWNAELAPVTAPTPSTVGPIPPKEKLKTDQAGSIEEVASFLGVEPKRVLKTLLLQTQNGPFLVAIRGDRTLSLAKFKRSQDVGDAELAQDLMGLPECQIGPIDQPLPIIADYSVADIQSGVAGANEPGYHWVNVSFSRDFRARALADLAIAQEGDLCGICRNPLVFSRGIEVGQVFYLGTKYSKAMGAAFLDAQGEQRPFVMGCYGIGIGRTIQAAVEQCHDAKGIRWPASLAPFSVHIILIEAKREFIECADALYAEFMERGVDVLYDDREERPGIKFNDADLIGLPYQLIIGRTYREQGKVEIKARDGSVREMVQPKRACEWILDHL
jgi:prolyl-tRNA synthetase